MEFSVFNCFRSAVWKWFSMPTLQQAVPQRSEIGFLNLVEQEVHKSQSEYLIRTYENCIKIIVDVHLGNIFPSAVGSYTLKVRTNIFLCGPCHRLIKSIILVFCYRGHPPKRLLTLKFQETMKRTIETISYCFKNNHLLSFAPPEIFSSRKPECTTAKCW